MKTKKQDVHLKSGKCLEPKEYLKLPYTRAFIKETDGRFSCGILEFIGCYSDGNTLSEANKNLEQAAISWLTATIAQGQSIPKPRGSFHPRGNHDHTRSKLKSSSMILNQFDSV